MSEKIEIHSYGVVKQKGSKLIVTPYLSSEEASDYMGPSPSTLSKWRRAGEGPRWKKVGDAKVLYHIDDINDWLKSRPSEQCKHRGGKGHSKTK